MRSLPLHQQNDQPGMNLQLFCKKNYINHLPNSMTAVFRNEKGNQLLSFLQSTLVNFIRQSCAKHGQKKVQLRSKVLTYAIIFSSIFTRYPLLYIYTSPLTDVIRILFLDLLKHFQKSKTTYQVYGYVPIKIGRKFSTMRGRSIE